MKIRLRISQPQRLRQVVKYTAFISLVAIFVFGIFFISGNLAFLKTAHASAPTNDNKVNATLLTNTTNWTSPKGLYTTLNATADGPRPGCRGNGPSQNVWFKFIAPANNMTIDLQIGGADGTLRFPYLVLWDSSMTEIGCVRYTTASGNLSFNTNVLTAGRFYYISVDNNQGYAGTFTIHVNAVSIVQVDLINFGVRIQDKQAVFTWETASETNNYLFTIERSADGINYTTVGTRPGAGNSSSDLSYHFYDESPLKGTSYYHLKQTDFYGQSIYFPSIVLYNGIPENTCRLYSAGPNPFEDQFYVRFYSPSQSEVEVVLVSPLGTIAHVEKTQPAQGSNTVEIKNLEGLKSGLYFLKLVQDGKSTVPVKVIRSE